MNVITIVGNLGAEPEPHVTDGGMHILRMRIATNRRKKVNGEWQDVADWHTVKVFGDQAESLGKLNLQKGTKVGISGSLVYSKWEKDGVKHERAEIEVRGRVELLSKRGEGGGSQQGSSRGGQSRGSSSQSSGGDFPTDDFGDDDIPF